MDTTGINGWLALWAGIAPILTGAASAIWSRRNQTSDRTFLRDQESEKYAREAEAHREAAARAWAESALVERRKTFLNFLTASHDFLWHLPTNQELNPAQEVELNRYREEFTRAYATLKILDAQAMDGQTVELWNAVWAARAMVSRPLDDPERTAAMTRMSRARSEFAISAHQLLAEQLGNLANAN
jgi:hypothetical protein